MSCVTSINRRYKEIHVTIKDLTYGIELKLLSYERMKVH